MGAESFLCPQLVPHSCHTHICKKQKKYKHKTLPQKKNNKTKKKHSAARTRKIRQQETKSFGIHQEIVGKTGVKGSI